MKRLAFLAVSLFLLSALVVAGPRALYRIELSNGSEVLSSDRPVQRGSVFLFHAYPGGSLTSLPQEEVVQVLTSVTEGNPQPPMLQPGETVYLGPTGGNPAPAAAASPATAAAAPMIPGGVYDPRMPIYGGNYLPRNTTVPVPVAPGDLARALSSAPPTAQTLVAPDGFPITGASPMIAPNGEPIIASPGTPGASTLNMGPNGTPVLAPSGAPGSTPLPIGPNGTPILSPPGAPGSAPPTIGPNGTPILAPPGAPGSTSPPIGPNGYPVPATGR